MDAEDGPIARPRKGPLTQALALDALRQRASALPGAARRGADQLGRAVAALMLPDVDDDALSGSGGMSAMAWSRITFLEEPVCDGCGTAMDEEVFTGHGGKDHGGDRCLSCITSPPAFDRARAAFVYDEHSRDLVLRLKHADRLDLVPTLTLWLRRAGAALIEDCDAVVPVPLHPARLLRRRFNQAAELARPLARASNRTYLADALQRMRDTGTQGGLSSRGRRRNVAAAFGVSRTGAMAVRGRRILLVDDVLTTGATAEACARALKQAGARSVDLLVLARVKSARALPR